MMFSIKRDIDAEKAKIRAEDQERYLWLSAFMLDYQGTLWSNWREDKRETQVRSDGIDEMSVSISSFVDSGLVAKSKVWISILISWRVIYAFPLCATSCARVASLARSDPCNTAE